MLSSALRGGLPAVDAEQPVVRVVSVPADHPYVRRVTAASGVSVLPDPPVPGQPDGVWWPPVALDPEWIAANADAADVLHVHFGTESFPAGHLTACLEAARRVGWPTVFTLHDLQHPQLGGRESAEAYSAQLDELATGADALVTLTPGAADEIRRRWGRDARVIPHPALLDLDRMPPVPSSDAVRIGVHLKDLRPNVDGPGTVAALLRAVDELRESGVPAIAEVRMHHRVRDEAARDEVRRLCAASPHASLVEHERLADRELVVALARLDACVLPYRHGTHSGWLELCWDLAVPVAAPALGHYAEQHEEGVAVFLPGDAESLSAAIRELLTAPGAARSGTPERTDAVERRRRSRADADAASAATQASLYRELVAAAPLAVGAGRAS